MIVTVQIADVGPRRGVATVRRRPQPSEVPGLTYAETVISAPITDKLLPTPALGRVGLIAAWEDEDAFEEFCASHPLAGRLAGGWQVRLQPLRVSGAWPRMPGLPERQLPVEDEEPVAVLTLGRPRLTRLLPFLRSAAAAEADATHEQAMLASAGLAHPPRLVSTFTVWRSAAAMKDYSYRRAGAHQAAVRADRERPYHHESAFIRFRPLASRGSWGGGDPLAGMLPASRAAA
jgi:heme-degrading monooxygenase HmoA